MFCASESRNTNVFKFKITVYVIERFARDWRKNRNTVKELEADASNEYLKKHVRIESRKLLCCERHKKLSISAQISCFDAKVLRIIKQSIKENSFSIFLFWISLILQTRFGIFSFWLGFCMSCFNNCINISLFRLYFCQSPVNLWTVKTVF